MAILVLLLRKELRMAFPRLEGLDAVEADIIDIEQNIEDLSLLEIEKITTEFIKKLDWYESRGKDIRRVQELKKRVRALAEKYKNKHEFKPDDYSNPDLSDF